MLSKATKSPQSKIHVEVEKNINNVVVSNYKTPVNKGFARVFTIFKKPKNSNFLQLDTILDTL
jgi:hypothetical protein